MKQKSLLSLTGRCQHNAFGKQLALSWKVEGMYILLPSNFMLTRKLFFCRKSDTLALSDMQKKKKTNQKTKKRLLAGFEIAKTWK